MPAHSQETAFLKEYFTEGFKKPHDLKVGVEWEKIGVYAETGQAIRYSGPRGVEALLEALVKNYQWEPVLAGAHPIALKKRGSSITLEPGGQIELSGQKASRLDENADELHRHLAELKEVSAPMGIAWLGIGLQPISTVDEIEWVPKERYAIMKESLKGRGTLTHAMMKQTASVQISLDFTSERDAVEKLRLAMGLAPLLSALFANSPLTEGKTNGFYSMRSHIWAHTAPERTGVLFKIFDPDFTLDDYIDYALSVPMLFIVRQGQWIPMNDISFRDFLARGSGPYQTIPADWDLHLTTIFTEARLKKYLEIRSIDCQRTRLGMAAPALLKGIFYDEKAREEAWELVADLSPEERHHVASEAPLKGLKTAFKGKTLLEPAMRLLKLGEEGLGRLAEKGLASKNEADYLSPLIEIICRRHMTPAETLLECLGAGNGSRQEFVKKIIACASI